VQLMASKVTHFPTSRVRFQRLDTEQDEGRGVGAKRSRLLGIRGALGRFKYDLRMQDILGLGHSSSMLRKLHADFEVSGHGYRNEMF
jgi:hypothetical protein